MPQEWIDRFENSSHKHELIEAAFRKNEEMWSILCDTLGFRAREAVLQEYIWSHYNRGTLQKKL
jgi:hypothetical protein